MFVRTKCVLPNGARFSDICNCTATPLASEYYFDFLGAITHERLLGAAEKKKLVTKSGFCGLPLNEFVLSALPASVYLFQPSYSGKVIIKKLLTVYQAELQHEKTFN